MGFPEGNNVYGVVTAAAGLGVVRDAMRPLLPDASVSIYRSGYDGAETLRVRSDLIDMDGEATGDGSEYLLNGAIGPTTGAAVRFAKVLTETLRKAGVGCTFEAYGPDGTLLAQF